MEFPHGDVVGAGAVNHDEFCLCEFLDDVGDGVDAGSLDEGEVVAVEGPLHGGFVDSVVDDEGSVFLEGELEVGVPIGHVDLVFAGVLDDAVGEPVADDGGGLLTIVVVVSVVFGFFVARGEHDAEGCHKADGQCFKISFHRVEVLIQIAKIRIIFGMEGEW